MHTQDTMSREEKTEALNRLIIRQNVTAAHNGTNKATRGYLNLSIRTIAQAKADVMQADKAQA